MLVGSTIFPRKDIRKYMGTRPENMQPDTSKLMCVKTMRGANIESDQHLVKATIRAHISNVRTTQHTKETKETKL